jgi:U3 small nucleolar RNA-associated protein 7
MQRSGKESRGQPRGKARGGAGGKSERQLMEERAARREKLNKRGEGEANPKQAGGGRVGEDGELVALRGAGKHPAAKRPDNGGAAAVKYQRGERNVINSIKDKKLRMEIRRSEKAAREAATRAARAEILLPSEPGFLEAEGMERTFKFKQQDIKAAVDVGSAKKVFTLRLDDLGPYCSRYSRNGRHLLLGGRRGHLALADWMAGTVTCEVQVKETVRDVSFLHNETLFAVAQKKYVYIYDNQGLEVHCMRNHIEVNRMAFLPYHYLLATVGNAGFLKYQDTSTGELVAELRTKLGRCDCMALNPYNAIVHLGHSNGTVTLWAPSMSSAVVSIFTHRAPVSAVAVDAQGRYMATAGLDGQLIRNSAQYSDLI